MPAPAAAQLPPLDAACPKCSYKPSAEVPACPKCAASLEGIVPPPHHLMQWIGAIDDFLSERPLLLPYAEPREHMQMICRRCAFRWPAAPEDQNKEVP